jgi:hypothetical protein
VPETSLAAPSGLNGHAPASPPEAARPPRHLSYITGEYSIRLGYAELTIIMDAIYDVWDSLETSGTMDNKAGDMVEALLERVAGLRNQTGWAGVPGICTGEVNP